MLFHGRGADEHDLFGLLDALDPERVLLGVTARGPLSLPPGGAHWYRLGDLGYPDPGTFLPTFELVSGWLDALAETTGIEPARTVLGGFSQGAVMTYALGLGRAGRGRRGSSRCPASSPRSPGSSSISTRRCRRSRSGTGRRIR